jgi:hypothetical protein
MPTAHQGLFDRLAFPDRLVGHVVEPGPDPRIHGYATRGDLARGASFVEVAWLALRGELPTPAEQDALSFALVCLAPLHVGEGPGHAAVLARTAGAPPAVLPGLLATAIGQHTARELAAARPLLDWLDGAEPTPPDWAVLEAPDAAAVADADGLHAASRRWFGEAGALPPRPVLGRVAAGWAVLHRLGVRDEVQLHAFSAWARLPVLLAEAAATPVGAVTAYPARLPDYRYVEGP